MSLLLVIQFKDIFTRVDTPLISAELALLGVDGTKYAC